MAAQTPPDSRSGRLLALGEIAAEIVHELRNELQIVSANVYLARKAPAETDVDTCLVKIERAARIAHEIVDDMMALARGEELRTELVRFDAIIARAREGLAPVRYEDTIDAVDLAARVHLGLMSRLFRALYENAIAATATTITTRAVREGARVVIDVIDDGPGVPAHLIETLFEPLVTGRAGGTGLGLALARRVALEHGGTIAIVPSTTGAHFRVELNG
jgi:signal transduction histidine kinase